ncbi:MAG: beta-lactamase family protein [Saprospiraceae bacterium]|nr:beta-lactamase family protein [Saprospiraceae bacterium]
MKETAWMHWEHWILLSMLVFLASCAQQKHIPVGHSVHFSVDTIVQPFVSNRHSYALSIGILRNGQSRFYNYGRISKTDATSPTQHSLYEIGSITKTFTTTVLAEMVKKSEVSLDDPITKFLPDSVCKWPQDRPITFLDLATHHSGLPRIPENLKKSYKINPANPYSNYFEEDLLEFLAYHKPIALEERTVSYSNLGMGLLGYLLMNIEDLGTYESLVDKYIFRPLDMNESVVNESSENLVPGHDNKGHAVSHWEMSALAGAGGIRSSTQDMIKYVEACLTNKFPSDILFQPRYRFGDQGEIGLAWFLRKNESNGSTIIWHNGGTGGFRSFLAFDPDQNLGVVVLTNSTHSVDDIGFQLIERLTDKI